MPKRKRRFTADDVCVARSGFVTETPEYFAAARGERLRGNHPIVRAHPDQFVLDGTPEREWGTRFDRAIATSEAEAAAEPPALEPKIPPSTPASELMVAVDEIVMSPEGPLAQGEIVLASDPRVARAPTAFRPLIEVARRN